MNLLRSFRTWVKGGYEAWDAESDRTVQYLRQNKNRALRRAEELRAVGIPLTGNILEDNATGAASRYRRYHQNGMMR